jgi:cytoskeletal protein RodZ
MDIGAYLREARERQGITLRQLADVTKLSTAALQHIERNEFDRLPGGIFKKAYVRAFATEVGVEPAAVLDALRLQCETEAAGESPANPQRARMLGRIRRYLMTAALAIGATGFAYTLFQP